MAIVDVCCIFALHSNHSFSYNHSAKTGFSLINAIKADGEVDQNEINRITGKLKGIGVDPEAQRCLMTLIQQPMETERLITAARGQSEFAAQIYGASLLAIEVDTPAEKKYLDQLATGLGLSAKVIGRIQELVGLQQA